MYLFLWLSLYTFKTKIMLSNDLYRGWNCIPPCADIHFIWYPHASHRSLDNCPNKHKNVPSRLQDNHMAPVQLPSQHFDLQIR